MADPAGNESGIDVLTSGAQLIRRIALHIPLIAWRFATGGCPG